MSQPIPELSGLDEAEEWFEALGVAFDPRILDAHRLHVVKAFGLAAQSWLEANPAVEAGVRRAALARALRAAYDVFAEDGPAPRQNPFAPGLVQLGRRR